MQTAAARADNHHAFLHPHPQMGPANGSALDSWLAVANGTLGNRTPAETGKVLAYWNNMFSLVARNPSATTWISLESLPQRCESPWREAPRCPCHPSWGPNTQESLGNTTRNRDDPATLSPTQTANTQNDEHRHDYSCKSLSLGCLLCSRN